MKTDRLDPFKLSVELDGIAAINACISMFYAQEGEKPNDEIMSNAFIAIEEHLERISEDVMNLDKLIPQTQESSMTPGGHEDD